MNSAYLLASVLSQFGDVRAGYIPADLKVAQVILVIAAGLSIHCLAKAGIRRASVAFCSGVASSSFALLYFGQPYCSPTLVIGFTVVLGALAAMRFIANIATASIIIFLIGSALVAASVPANGEFPQAMSLMAANVIVGAGAIICLSQLVVILNPVRAPAWRSIAVRIAGSWVFAISVLVIAISSQANFF